MPFKVRLLALVKPVAMRFHKVTGHMSFRNETHGPSVRHSRGGLHYCPSSLLTPDYKLLISTWSRTALTLSQVTFPNRSSSCHIFLQSHHGFSFSTLYGCHITLTFVLDFHLYCIIEYKKFDASGKNYATSA